MLKPSTPVSLVDVMETLAPDGVTIQFLWAAVRFQLSRGAAFAIRGEDGRALAIGGFWPADTYREAWAIIAPRAAPRIGEIVRAARLTLASLPEDDPRPVIAIARSPAGERLARLLGFRQASARGTWVWSGNDGGRRQGHLRRG